MRCGESEARTCSASDAEEDAMSIRTRGTCKMARRRGSLSSACRELQLHGSCSTPVDVATSS